MIGQTLNGRYKILALLGAGSMGVVYRALQLGIDREVAVKVLKKSRNDANSKARFLREARAASALASPHTVRVFDFGEVDGGELFLVMEVLEGESLAQRLRRVGHLPVREALETALQGLKSLDEAHAKGLIHRDLKPSNLFYARVAAGERAEEIVKLLDFGGAKFVGRKEADRNAVDTQEGFIVGTPRYMSPEQARGAILDTRSDLYSLGAVLYHMVTGRPPFTEDDAEIVLAHHLKTMPELPSVACPEALIPSAIDALVMRSLAKDPADRPQTAAGFMRLLTPLIDGRTSAPRTSQPDESGEGGHPDISATSAPAAVEPETETRERLAASRPRRAWLVWALVTLTAVAVVLMVAVRGTRSNAGTDVAEPAATTFVVQGSKPTAAPGPSLSPPPASAAKAVPLDALPRVPAGSPPRARVLSHGNSGAGVLKTQGTPVHPPPAPSPTPAPSSDYSYFE